MVREDKGVASKNKRKAKARAKHLYVWFVFIFVIVLVICVLSGLCVLYLLVRLLISLLVSSRSIQREERLDFSCMGEL